MKTQQQSGPKTAVTLMACLFACVFTQAAPAMPPLSDDDFRTAVQQGAFNFFWEKTDPLTVLTQDRGDKNGNDDFAESSIASAGFGLAALPVGVEHGWITREAGRARALAALRYAYFQLPNVNGFFYHFINMHTGARSANSEVSSLDTSIFLCGALAAGQYFGGEALDLANALYDRADWNWMRTNGGTQPDKLLISGGWTPESGFMTFDYGYCEAQLMYLLAIGARTNAIPAASWTAVGRPVVTYDGLTTLGGGPIFLDQMPLGFFPMYNRTDSTGWDFWDVAVNDTLINRQFCMDEATEGIQPAYGPDFWGLNASDGPGGYQVSGAPSGPDNGTLCPTGPLASMPFTPDESTAAGQAMYNTYGDQLWGRYGFGDGYNVSSNWFDTQVIGIDLGMAELAIENWRDGLLWRLMGSHPATQRAYLAAGLPTTINHGTTYTIQSFHSGLLCEVSGGVTNNGGVADQWPGNRTAAQKWTAYGTGDGYWYFINANSGKCLEVGALATYPGAVVQQWDYDAIPWQQWSFQSISNGYYALVNRATGYVLGVNDGSAAPGATLLQWPYWGGDDQKWRFDEVPPAPAGLMAFSGNGGIILSWNATAITTSYNVKRSAVSDGPYATIAIGVTNTTFTDSGLSNGVTNYYVVSSVNNSAEGNDSPEISGTAGAFGNGNALPAGWTDVDIGSPALLGQASYNASMGAWMVTGSGADIWDTNDQCNFAYEPLAGDGVIGCWVANVQNTNPWAKAGVMIRESLDPGSTHAMMVFTPGFGAAFQGRGATGGISSNVSVTSFSAPGWVKLVRAGNAFTGWLSSDGATWEQVGSATINMATNVYIGLAVTAHDSATTNTSTFYHLSTTPPLPPTDIGAAQGVEQVTVSWTASAGAVTYNVKRATTAGGPYTNVACVSSLRCTDAGLTSGTNYYYVVSAVNPAGESANSAEVSAQPSTSFAAYQQQYFTTAQLVNPGISGLTADANGDGVNNLLAYAFGLSPWTMATVANGGVPTVQIQSGCLTIRFVQLTCAVDLTYMVEVSSDLVTWNSGPTYTTQTAVAAVDSARTQVAVRDNIPVSDLRNRFMRVRIVCSSP
jgi:hypothetical protein